MIASLANSWLATSPFCQASRCHHLRWACATAVVSMLYTRLARCSCCSQQAIWKNIATSGNIPFPTSPPDVSHANSSRLVVFFLWPFAPPPTLYNHTSPSPRATLQPQIFRQCPPYPPPNLRFATDAQHSLACALRPVSAGLKDADLLTARPGPGQERALLMLVNRAPVSSGSATLQRPPPARVSSTGRARPLHPLG